MSEARLGIARLAEAKSLLGSAENLFESGLTSLTPPNPEEASLSLLTAVAAPVPGRGICIRTGREKCEPPTPSQGPSLDWDHPQLLFA